MNLIKNKLTHPIAGFNTMFTGSARQLQIAYIVGGTISGQSWKCNDNLRLVVEEITQWF